MITNEKQYKITKSTMDKFLESIEKFSQNNSEPSSKIEKARRDAFISQYEELKEEVDEYEKLKSGLVSFSEANSINELPELLIKARIAQGLTQGDLAAKLGMSPQQIQRYEAELYYSASFKRLKEVADVLEIKLKNSAEFTLNQTKENFWSNFPMKEMFERGWFEGFQGSLKEAIKNSEELITEFFERIDRGDSLVKIFHKKNIRAGSKCNAYALEAWHTRVLQKAFFRQEKLPNFDLKKINQKWFEGLIALSVENNGPILAKQYLEESGIHLIIEPHLDHTFLDGAAIKGIDKSPIVAMTLRYDRIDNFWFVLIHELCHIIKHLYSQNEEEEFFDDLDSESKEPKEIEADSFSYETLISKSKWDSSLVKLFFTHDNIVQQAKEWKISPAIIAGRIRRERNNYSILNEMVGQNKVRYLFDGEVL